MPNICSNQLKVYGNRQQLNSFKNTYINQNVNAEQEAFSFNSIIPEPIGLSNIEQYNWRSAIWDTKWDASNVNIEQQDNYILISFDTAWCPPINVIEKLADQRPDLHIKLIYEDPGQNFAGYLYYHQEELLVSERDDFYSQTTLDAFNAYDDWNGEGSEPEDPYDIDYENPFIDLFQEDIYIPKQNKKITYKFKNIDFKSLKKINLLSRKSLIKYLSNNLIRYHLGMSKMNIRKIINNHQRTKILKSKDCSICFNKLKKPIQTKCKHIFCFDCMQSWKSIKNDKVSCPLCRTAL